MVVMTCTGTDSRNAGEYVRLVWVEIHAGSYLPSGDTVFRARVSAAAITVRTGTPA